MPRSNNTMRTKKVGRAIVKLKSQWGLERTVHTTAAYAKRLEKIKYWRMKDENDVPHIMVVQHIIYKK